MDALEEVRNARQTQSGRTGELQPTGQPTGRPPSERATATGAGTGDPTGGAEGANVPGGGVRRLPRRDPAVGGGGDTTTGAGDETVDTETGDELPTDTPGQPGGLDGSDTEVEEGGDTAPSDTPPSGSVTDATGERPRPTTRSEPTAGTDAETVVEDEPDAIFRPRRNQQIEPELH